MGEQTQTPPASGGWFDTFAQIANGYFQWKTAEQQADATGQGQVNLNNTVEQQAGVGQVPLTGGQYNSVGGQVAGVNTTTLMVGGLGLVLAVLLLRK